MHVQNAIAPLSVNKPNARLYARVWPWAAIILAVALNAVWVAFLGYGFVRLIMIEH
jgi:hypothetical protein